MRKLLILGSLFLVSPVLAMPNVGFIDPVDKEEFFLTVNLLNNDTIVEFGLSKAVEGITINADQYSVASIKQEIGERDLEEDLVKELFDMFEKSFTSPNYQKNPAKFLNTLQAILQSAVKCSKLGSQADWC